MPIRLRSARADDSEDIPIHYECLGLRPDVRIVGWIAGVSAVAGGIALMILRQGSWVEVLGAVGGAAGAIAVAGLIRCRRFEITLGRRWLVAGAGPLRHRVAPDSVEHPIEEREATGWRRLYSPREEVLRLTVHGTRLILPTLEPGALGAALSAGGVDEAETGVEDPA